MRTFRELIRADEQTDGAKYRKILGKIMLEEAKYLRLEAE